MCGVTSYLVLRSKIWGTVNFLIPVALIFNSQETATYSGVSFVFLSLLFASTFFYRIPLYLTNPHALASLLNIVQRHAKDKKYFVDLGCGTGTTIVAIAKNFPDLEIVGYEVSLLPYLISKFRALRYPKVKIKFKSFWKESLLSHSIIYTFLSPEPMNDIRLKIVNEKISDYLLISNSFAIPEISYIEKIQNSSGQDLYVYKKT
jgi:SAM-dependent methyltransferase